MPTEAALSPQEAAFHHRPGHQSSDLLTEIDVTENLPAVTDILTATLTITEFALEDGQLLVSGTLTYTTEALGTVIQEFSGILADLFDPDGGACRILFLDLGPIFLDLLGLEVDLSPVELEIRAQPGPGNLVGNLLCVVAHLLDGPGAIIAILNLIDRINNLLG